MATMAAFGRRLWIAVYTLVMTAQGVGFEAASVGMVRWANQWWLNRQSIVMLTAVNTTLTTGMEFVSRSIAEQWHPAEERNDYAFIVAEPDGSQSINRQSIVNIWMTFFASLLGGPVYFFRRRLHRFWFFIGFGCANSYMSQLAGHYVRDGLLAIATSRLLFDIIYNGTFKFMMFEWLRRPIVAAQTNFLRIGSFRVLQDLLTTLFRVVVLNVLGFKG